MAKGKPRWNDLPFEDRIEKKLVRRGMTKEDAAHWKNFYKKHKKL